MSRYCIYTPINGYTKQAIKDQISREFKGKAVDLSTDTCSYLTPDGRKCIIGIFIPNGHLAQESPNSIIKLLMDNKDLSSFMPLQVEALIVLQQLHDKLDWFSPKKAQLNVLLEWVDTYVADALPQQDVGTI